MIVLKHRFTTNKKMYGIWILNWILLVISISLFGVDFGSWFKVWCSCMKLYSMSSIKSTVFSNSMCSINLSKSFHCNKLTFFTQSWSLFLEIWVEMTFCVLFGNLLLHHKSIKILKIHTVKVDSFRLNILGLAHACMIILCFKK